MTRRLYDFQLHDADAIEAALRSYHSVLYCLPTGGGKTTVADELTRRETERGGSVLFLADRQELVRQAHDRIGGRVVMGSYRPTPDADRPDNPRVTIASVATLARRTEGPDATLVFADEAHLYAASSFSRVLSAYRDSGARVVGLTATPARLDGQGLGTLFDTVVQGPSAETLIANHYLSPVVHKAPTGAWWESVRLAAGDFDTQGLEAAGGAVLKDISARWAALGGILRPTLVFAPTKQYAHRLADEFSALLFLHGLPPAEVITDDTPAAVRRSARDRIQAGALRVAITVGVLGTGFDAPAVSCIVMARPTLSWSLYLQQGGRGMRTAPETGKRDCVAEGSLVLTQRGEVPIENISNDDMLWDGNEFVSHGGLIPKGERDVIWYAGLWATPDHQVSTKEGWKSFGQAAREQIPIAQTGLGGTPVREADGYFSCGGVDWEEMEQEGAPSLPVPDLWAGETGSVLQPQGRPSGLSLLLLPEAVPEVAICQGQFNATAVREPASNGLRKIWWERDSVQVQFGNGSGSLGARESWDTGRGEGAPARQDRQRRPLRVRKYPMVLPDSKHGAYQQDQERGQVSSIPVAPPGDQVRRQHTASLNVGGADGRTNTRTLDGPILQTKRQVWDILNCGPRHRFTVQGLLVHNCLLIDCAGNSLRHGYLTKPFAVDLDGVRRKHRRATAALTTCRKCWRVYEWTLSACPECSEPKPRGAERRVREVDGELVELTGAEIWAERAKTDDKVRKLAAWIREGQERRWDQKAPLMRFKGLFSRWPKREEIEQARRMVGGAA